MKKNKIIIKTQSKSYPIFFGSKILNSTASLINKNLRNTKKISIVVDKKLPNLFIKTLTMSLKKYKPRIYKLSLNEKKKNFKLAYKLIENLLRDNLSRSDCVIAMGGGILGDLTAFASSLTKRGVKFINIPTSLLAQVDASIGGKTAINSNQGKNLIGTFYQPDFVIIDTSFLKSLPRREMICGYGEILKHALILDGKFFSWLSKNAQKLIDNKDKNILKHAIVQSCKIKAKIINKDEREENSRMLLNFGHTFAHGFEGANNFSKNLNHGEAVILGMMAASKLSYEKKLLKPRDLNLIKKHYVNLKLPMKVEKFFKKNQISKIISFMKKDKKNLNNKLNLILLKKIGKTTKPNSCHVSVLEMKKFLSSFYVK